MSRSTVHMVGVSTSCGMANSAIGVTTRTIRGTLFSDSTEIKAASLRCNNDSCGTSSKAVMSRHVYGMLCHVLLLLSCPGQCGSY
jgi:hypothetical protein